jgi:hypothetical protein
LLRRRDSLQGCRTSLRIIHINGASTTEKVEEFTNKPVQWKTPPGNSSFPDSHWEYLESKYLIISAVMAIKVSYHHVTRQQLQTQKNNPENLNVSDGYLNVKCAHITRPQGNTKPPRIFTIPGFDAVKPGEPPVMTTLRRPPNDSITPARTYKKIISA